MELQAWKYAGLAPEFESRLIRPSGSLDSLIAYYLNQPSFSTTFNSQLGNYETVDKSNGCIATVMSLVWLKFWLVGWQPFQNRNQLELFLACN